MWSHQFLKFCDGNKNGWGIDSWELPHLDIWWSHMLHHVSERNMWLNQVLPCVFIQCLMFNTPSLSLVSSHTTDDFPDFWVETQDIECLLQGLRGSCMQHDSESKLCSVPWTASRRQGRLMICLMGSNGLKSKDTWNQWSNGHQEKYSSLCRKELLIKMWWR